MIYLPSHGSGQSKVGFMNPYIFADKAIRLVKSTEERCTVLLQKLIHHRESVDLDCLAKEVNQRVVQVMKIILNAHYAGGLRELKNSHLSGGVFFLLNCILDKSPDERGEKPDLSNDGFLLDVWSVWLFVCGKQEFPHLGISGKFEWRMFTPADENGAIASRYYQNLDNLEAYLQDSVNLLGVMAKHLVDITELRDSGYKPIQRLTKGGDISRKQVRPEDLRGIELADEWKITAQPHIEDPGVNSPAKDFSQLTECLVTWCDLHQLDASVLWEVYRQVVACRKPEPDGYIGPRQSPEKMKATYRKAIDLCSRIKNLAVKQQALEGGKKDKSGPKGKNVEDEPVGKETEKNLWEEISSDMKRAIQDYWHKSKVLKSKGKRLLIKKFCEGEGLDKVTFRSELNRIETRRKRGWADQ